MYVGTTLVWSSRTEEAIEQFRATLALDPTYVQGHRYLGQSYEKAGEVENAIAAYRKAIELIGGWLGAGGSRTSVCGLGT